VLLEAGRGHPSEGPGKGEGAASDMRVCRDGVGERSSTQRAATYAFAVY
jgi:hypothetical protein